MQPRARSRSPPTFDTPLSAIRRQLHPGCTARLKGLNVQVNEKQVLVQEQLTNDKWRVKMPSGNLKVLKAEYLQFDRPAIEDNNLAIEQAKLKEAAEKAKLREHARRQEAEMRQAAEEAAKKALGPGSNICLHGLKGAAELNGQAGVLEEFVQQSGRWRVKLASGVTKDIKPDNIQMQKVSIPQDEPQQKPVPQRQVEMISESLMCEAKMLEAELNGELTGGDAIEAKVGDAFGPGNRFVVADKLGEGTYATVFRCRDTQAAGMEYAVKFSRKSEQTKTALQKEIKVIKRIFAELGKKDPEGVRCLVGLAFFEGFEHQGTLSAVFQLMKYDLRTALAKYGAGKGLPLLPTVRNFGKNIFLALRVLRQAGLMHCDVKPENLLMTKDNESVKLCDFGSIMGLPNRLRTDKLQPRTYRALEVILGLEYDMQIDIWSAGATLFEIATDRVLFLGETNNEVLHEMLKTVGSFPVALATSGLFSLNHFSANGDFLNSRGDIAINSTNPRVIPMAQFDSPPRPITSVLEQALKEPPRGVPLERHVGLVRHFSDLLGSCLLPDATLRAKPEAALAHRFFQKGA